MAEQIDPSAVEALSQTVAEIDQYIQSLSEEGTHLMVDLIHLQKNRMTTFVDHYIFASPVVLFFNSDLFESPFSMTQSDQQYLPKSQFLEKYAESLTENLGRSWIADNQSKSDFVKKVSQELFLKFHNFIKKLYQLKLKNLEKINTHTRALQSQLNSFFEKIFDLEEIKAEHMKKIKNDLTQYANIFFRFATEYNHPLSNEENVNLHSLEEFYSVINGPSYNPHHQSMYLSYQKIVFNSKLLI